MLVPLSRPNVPSLAGSDESTDTPGALTSGFICSETGVGPPEEKPAITLRASAAAMPATCVAWNDSVGSNGLFANFHVGDGGANARCTITFRVANCVCPFGKPGGYWNPLGLKYGFEASIPSSITAIFIPFPAVA